MSIGGITFKTINGKRYAYYQWTENGKQHSLTNLRNSLQKLQQKKRKRTRQKTFSN